MGRVLRNIVAATASLAALTLLACAASGVSQPREAYTTAQGHGFVDLVVVDESIPLDGEKIRPPSCRVELFAGRELVLDELVFPAGEAAPFRLETEFRSPLTAGFYSFSLTYSDCGRYQEGQEEELASRITVHARANVVEGMVTELAFDGESLVFEGLADKTVTTLGGLGDQVDGECGCG